MKTLAVDIDGTLVEDAGISRFKFVQLVANILLFLPPVRYFYLRRKVKETKEWLVKRKERGYLIIIVSGTWEWHRNLVEKFLRKNNIPFHYLVLSHPLYFSPLVAKQELRWDILIENDATIVAEIAQNFRVKVRRIGGIYVVRRSH